MASLASTSPKPPQALDSSDIADPRLKGLDRVLKRHRFEQDALIEVLTVAQESFGYLREDVLAYVARRLQLPLSWVYGVATFYHFFSLAPKGLHHCVVCLGTACYVGGSAQILAAMEERFGIKSGETTRGGELTLSTTRCLGSCGLAPVVVLDGEILGRQSPGSVVERVAVLAEEVEKSSDGLETSTRGSEEKR